MNTNTESFMDTLLGSMASEKSAKPLKPKEMLRIMNMTSVDDITEHDMQLMMTNITARRAFQAHFEELKEREKPEIKTSNIEQDIKGMFNIAKEAANDWDFIEHQWQAASTGEEVPLTAGSISEGIELGNNRLTIQFDYSPITGSDQEDLELMVTSKKPEPYDIEVAVMLASEKEVLLTCRLVAGEVEATSFGECDKQRWHENRNKEQKLRIAYREIKEL